LLVVIGVSALGFISFHFFTEDLVAVVGRDATFTGRTEIWSVVLDSIWQKPVLGFGYYAGNADFIRPLLVGQIGPAAVDAHNGYLDVMLGTGMVGLISLLFCILAVLVRGFGRVKISAGSKVDCLMLLLIFPFSSLLFMLFEGAMTEVGGTLDTLTFLSLTAIPFYLRREFPSRLRNLGSSPSYS